MWYPTVVSATEGIQHEIELSATDSRIGNWVAEFLTC
jgi:hypothetical protein